MPAPVVAFLVRRMVVSLARFLYWARNTLWGGRWPDAVCAALTGAVAGAVLAAVFNLIVLAVARGWL